jgi:prepilin-type N-terminal cleavage/methylation domain-containing protein
MKSILPKINKGFTLVELLVVMAILGILATITLANFSSSQKKGRDAQRKSDLRQIANAFEAYMNDHGAYPAVSANGEIVMCGCSTPIKTCVWGSTDPAYREFCDTSNTVYMKDVPSDVKAGTSWNNYCYWTDSKSFKLYADFENANDPDCLVKVNNICQKDGAHACGGVSYMYGIASSNSTP